MQVCVWGVGARVRELHGTPWHHVSPRPGLGTAMSFRRRQIWWRAVVSVYEGPYATGTSSGKDLGATIVSSGKGMPFIHKVTPHLHFPQPTTQN